MVVVKKRAAEYYNANKEVPRENAKNKYRNLSEVEKKQKENMGEIDIETWQKMKRTSWKIIKEKIKQQKNKIQFFLVYYKNEWKDIKIWWCWS